MCKFSFVGLVWLVYQYLCNRSPFFLPIRASQGAAILVCPLPTVSYYPSHQLAYRAASLPMKGRKRSSYDLLDTSADLVLVINTDCSTQNGRTHSLVFVSVKSHTFLGVVLNKCTVPLEFLPWENRVAFPGESQLRLSRATQPTVHAGCFSVSMIRRTLTWTTGSLMCPQMLTHAVAHGGGWTS